MIELMSTEVMGKLAYSLLAPLVREMSEDDQNVNARLRNVAIRVGDAIRSKIGDDEYNMLRAKIIQKLMIRRAERKKVITMEKISDPVRAAQRTQGIRERKKVSKRKRQETFKTNAAPKKKRKMVDHDF